jgi:hypothetical protein
MDWEILIRLGIYFDFAYINEDLGCLREYGEAKTFTGGAKRIREIRKILYEYTGQHFPPGVLVYGLDTYQQIWNANIEHWPDWLNVVKPLARKIVTRISHKVIHWAARRGQAWWRDMWMGPSAYTMLPQGSGEIVMRGMIPQIEGLERQTITIRNKRRVVHKASLAPGQFELRFTPMLSSEESPVFHIRSSQSFSFSKVVGSSDERILSMRVTDFRWARAT